MKVVIVGTRGIPARYGGFETFAEELSARLAESGMEISVVCQKSEIPVATFEKVKLLYSLFSKEQNPLRFYLHSLKIAWKTADIILVCGVGGAVFYPFLMRKGKILLTHVDGREELRGKYSWYKKKYVSLAQWFAARFSTHLIADSFAVKRYWEKKYDEAREKISCIEFGADVNQQSDDSILSVLKIREGDYYLIVCRIVPENHVGEMISGFLKSKSQKKLVVVGNVNNGYGKRIQENCGKIIYAGSIYDRKKLFALRRNAFAYLHGHSVGGTNPSLLESMAAGSVCICHDNEFNRETTANEMLYFKNVEELSIRIQETESFTDIQRRSLAETGKQRILNYYNWDRIKDEYIRLFGGFWNEG